jgi:hypothetical protein
MLYNSKLLTHHLNTHPRFTLAMPAVLKHSNKLLHLRYISEHFVIAEHAKSKIRLQKYTNYNLSVSLGPEINSDLLVRKP